MGLRVSRPALEDCLQDLPGVKIDSTQVEETDEILGSGAYGEVIVALYNGMRYASKKLHEALVENDERISPNDPNSPVRKFREECQRMSQLRHPNIVQFIGVYFKSNAPPCLLMELLPIRLAGFLEDKTSIGFDRKCLILLDVAKGLLCLHSHSPPIIHRDLTANNVLLTSGLTAKIADFGVARYLPLPTETGGQYMTICPGNLNYMPPEAKKENALYDTKLDIFSFGHLTIYVATRKWPILMDKSFENPETGDTDYRTEIERRNESLQMMTEENLRLHQLAILCLQDNANGRPTTKKIIELLTEMIPDTDSKSQTLLDEIDQLKQKLQAKINEVEELKRQLAIINKDGPFLRVTGNLPLECTQEADGSLLIKLNVQAAISADPSELNVSRHVSRTVTAARPTSLPTNSHPKPQGAVINGEPPESRPAPIKSNTVVPPSSVPLSAGSMVTEISSQNEVTNGSVEVQRLIFNGHGNPSKPSKTQTPIQNKQTPPIPVPRTRTLPRGHTFKAETVPANTNPVEGFPLSGNDQSSTLPMTIPRSNTVGQLGLSTIQNDAVTITANLPEPREFVWQRSQTLQNPRRSPMANQNLTKSGGPTNELQALLAKRRRWEQNNTN